MHHFMHIKSNCLYQQVVLVLIVLVAYKIKQRLD